MSGPSPEDGSGSGRGALERESAEVGTPSADQPVRRRRDWSDDPDYLDKWGPAPVRFSREELARGAEVEAANVAAGLDGSGEVYTDEQGMPLAQYAKDLPPWQLDLFRRHAQATGGQEISEEPYAKDSAPTAELPDPGEDPGPGEAAGFRAESGSDAGPSSPAEIYEGVMSGALSASDARRLARRLAPETPGSTPEATTELVRAEGDLRYERGTETFQPDSFGETVASDETDKLSRLDRVERAVFRATGDGLNEVKKKVNTVHSLTLQRPPEGRSVTALPADLPRYESPQPQADAGSVGTAVLIAGVVLYKGSRWAIGRFGKVKETQDEHHG